MGKREINVDGLIHGKLLSFFRSVDPREKITRKTDCFIWGHLDYMQITDIDSFSEYYHKFHNGYEGSKYQETVDQRQLFLYKKQIGNDRAEESIFGVNNKQPLIVISQIKNFTKYTKRLKNIEKTLNNSWYKTLSYGIDVVVIRTSNINEAMNYLLELNKCCDFSYSIVGVQYFDHEKVEIDDLIYKDIAPKKNEMDHLDKTHVQLNYILSKNGRRKPSSRVVIEEIKKIHAKFLVKYGIDKNDLSIETYYQLGKYDIHIGLSGHIVYLLNLLLNPFYGLSLENSEFYKEYIFESKTTWNIIDNNL